MGKRKVKPSGFSVYMDEFIEQEHRLGQKRSPEQWANVVAPYYAKLTEEQKQVYKEKAKTLPAKYKVTQPKYTSQGILLEDLERERRELAEKQHYMNRKVHGIVENGFLENDISTRPFVFLMANCFYKTNDRVYPPAEIAAVKFNFMNAICKSYHTFVNPGSVHQGFALAAKEHSERTHRLTPPTTPPAKDARGETNYERIYAGILDIFDVRIGQTFGKDDQKRPCVFTRKQDVEMIESILDQLSDSQWRQTFDLFDMEELFNKLKNKVERKSGDDPIPISVTNVFIEQDRYDATPNISCDFHEKEDATRHCSLSYVTRWFYLFADHICEKIGIKLVPGRHLPANAALQALPSFEEDTWDDVASSSRGGVSGGNRAKNFRDGAYSMVPSAFSGYSKRGNEDDSESYESDDY